MPSLFAFVWTEVLTANVTFPWRTKSFFSVCLWQSSRVSTLSPVHQQRGDCSFQAWAPLGFQMATVSRAWFLYRPVGMGGRREAEGRMLAWLLRWSCCVAPLGFPKPECDDGGVENAWLCGFWHPTTGSKSQLCRPLVRDLGTLTQCLHASGIMGAGLYLMRRRSGYNEVTLLRVHWCKRRSGLKYTILGNVETGIWPNTQPSRPVSWSSGEGLLKRKPNREAPGAMQPQV